MWVWLLISPAHGDSGCGYVVSGFAVETRKDAPIDAELLIDATFVPIVSVVKGPNGPEPLDSEMLTACPMAGNGLATVSAPAGGWQPNATYTVEAQPGHDDSGGPVPFTFQTSDVGAAAPGDPTILSVTAADWTDDTGYAWGCCAPTRLVTITVESASTDPWSYVQLKGDFQGPSQITTEPVHGRLDVEIGPGVHELTYLQWKDDDGTLGPLAFEVSQVEANGVASKSQRVEIDVDGDADPPCCENGDGPDTGCVVAPPMPSILASLTALALARRRARSR
jgi:hypothetical protein